MAGFTGTPPIVTDGLVFAVDAANYESYPGSGTTWGDLVGGATPTLSNGPTFLNEFGGVISYDGTNDHCIINHNDLSYNRENFTCEVWVKFTGIHGNWRTGVFTKWNTGAGTNNEWFLGPINSSGPSLLGFSCQSPQNTGGDNNKGSFKVNSTTTYSVNTWYHIIGTFNGANSTQKIYINGNLEGTRTDFNDTEVKNVSSTRFWIGGFEVRVAILADIATARLYSKTLTSTEVLQNYNALKSRFNL